MADKEKNNLGIYTFYFMNSTWILYYVKQKCVVVQDTDSSMAVVIMLLLSCVINTDLNVR